MAVLTWDKDGDKIYEKGVDHGVLYVRDTTGAYPKGVVWNGLINVTESPTGAEASAQYADNIKYYNGISKEEFAGTVEAFTHPKEYDACLGIAEPVPGMLVTGQKRSTFGMSYRTKVGNDLEGDAYGQIIHLVYGASASVSEKAYATDTDTDEPITFSWEITTTPAPAAAPGLAPTAHLEFNSNDFDTAKWAQLEGILYGTDTDSGTEARLPLPSELVTLFGTESAG